MQIKKKKNVVPMDIFHMGNSGRFSEEKPAATESRATQPQLIKVHAGCVFVFP